MKPDHASKYWRPMPHNNRLALALLMSVLSAITGPAAGSQAANAGPALTIEEAIDIAKRCVLERNVRLVGSYIESARFVRKDRGERGPFWQVAWAYSREIKGGKVFVTVSDNRTCEITHGEQGQ